MGQYEQYLPLLKAVSPSWFDQIREAGVKRYQQVGLPTRHDEEFRFITLSQLGEIEFQPAYGATIHRGELASVSQFDDQFAYTIAFINGQFAPEISSVENLPQGLHLVPFDQASSEESEIIQTYLGKVADLSGKLGSNNDQRFVDLNNAHLGEGAFLYIEDGVEVEHPIHLLWVSKADHGPLAFYPRNLIVLGNKSRAQVLESYLGFSGATLGNSVSEIVIGGEAELVHVKLQDENDDAFHISNVSVRQSESSSYTSYNVNFGAHLARNEFNVFLEGESCHTRLDGVSVGLSGQTIANHTRIDHALPNCNSFEVYKTVLGDDAKGVFNGKIFVYQDAQKTDAKQTNQTLLLSKRASIDTKPQLEIFADDVKCTHGATVGQIAEESLFYLRSRGIPYEKAKAILVYAFAAEVLERIPNEELRQKLESKLFAKLMPSEEA